MIAGLIIVVTEVLGVGSSRKLTAMSSLVNGAVVINIGAFIECSAGLRAITSGGATLDPRLPVINPDDIVQETWTLVTQRDRVEAILPPLPSV